MGRVRKVFKALDKLLFPDIVYYENKVKRGEIKFSNIKLQIYKYISFLPYFTSPLTAVFLNPVAGFIQGGYSFARCLRHLSTSLQYSYNPSDTKQITLDSYLGR